MSEPMKSSCLPEVVDTALGCMVYETQWSSANNDRDLAVAVSGQALTVDLRRWPEGHREEIAAIAGEELAAVLEGCFELRCADETHRLEAGTGILIPPGVGRCWLACSTGVLYRVTCPPRA